MDNPPSAAFVATMGHQVVGVFVANREACGGDEVARLRSLFELEDFIAFDRHRPRNQAVMTALALNPIFAGHCRFALKEVRVCGGELRVFVNVHYGFIFLVYSRVPDTVDSSIHLLKTWYRVPAAMKRSGTVTGTST